MPYRRKPRTQNKHGNKGKIPAYVLKEASPTQRALIKFGFVPDSVANPVTHQPLTRKLASSSKLERDSGIEMVRALLANSDIKMDKKKMSQLWKALFYSFWMSDKVPIQQELARKLSNFVKICSNTNTAFLYIECFMECMEREWTGIDYLRMSKFQSLVRFFIHSSFDYLALNEWNLTLIKQFADILIHKMFLFDSVNRGLFLHLNDIYIDELVKVNRIDGDDHLLSSFRLPISFDALYNLLVPFIRIYLQSNKVFQQQYVIRKIFHKLMETMSFEAEQRETNLNCPGTHNVDLYKFNIDKHGRNRVIKKEKKEHQKNDVDMVKIDRFDPVRRRKGEKHLMFDKKNFDVVVPFKEFETGDDKKKITEWKMRYGGDEKKERLNDPLLMKQKMERFETVFKHLAKEKETPKKARKKLHFLGQAFVLKPVKDKYYDRESVKDALKLVDDRKQKWKWMQMKKEKKKKMRIEMTRKRKWNKMKKRGIKIKPSQLFLKRAARMIL